MTGLNLSCKFSFTTGTVNQLNQYSISDSSKRFLRFNKILRPRNQVLTDPWFTILSRSGLWLTILSRPGLFVVGWCVNLALRRICRNLSFKVPRLRNDPSWPCVTLSSKQWCFSFSSKAEIQTSFKTLILHLPKVPS